MNLDQYLSKLIEIEGGYVDHPNDRGGPTIWGITTQTARAFKYTGDIQAMTKETAKRIYAERYWHEPKFDLINTISPAIAEELLDTGVNMGPATATKFLQRALNHLNHQGRHWPDIAVDGRIGSMTVQCLRDAFAKRGLSVGAVILRMLNAQQSVRYMEITEANASQEDFAFGWQANRVV